MEMSLRQRTKFGLAVRLEVDTNITPEVLALLCRELELGANDVYQVDAPLDLSGLWDLYSLRRPELKYPTFTPQNPPPLAGGKDSDVFWAMRNGDVLLHHPYDSFANSVEAFVEQAASDDSVLAIKQALYRTGGDEAGIVASLVKAAEAGKQVVALVELKARFDEQANIERARMLEQAGAHVVYGLVGLKTHAKVLLVVRQEADGIRRYCHFGTGNYNPKTATTYEDLGVLSSDPDLGSDLLGVVQPPHRLQPARRVPPAARRADAPARRAARPHPRPGAPRRRDHDEDQRARRLRDDRRAVRGVAARARGSTSSCAASAACAPAFPASPRTSPSARSSAATSSTRGSSASERPATDDTEYVIGSADLMPRNLDRRVEAMLRVTDPRMRARLDEILAINFADDVLAWTLERDGDLAQGRDASRASSRRCGSRSWRSRGPRSARPTA